MKRLILYKCLFGSKLYGTDGPDSDTDYKVVYLPSKSEVLLGEANKSLSVSSCTSGKNVKDDVDTDYYSFQKFLNLLKKSEQNCLDVLFSDSNEDAVIEKHPMWDQLIISNRDKFLTKNLKSSFGFMRSQVNRYSVRGDRMQAVEDVINLLKSFDGSLRVKDAKDSLIKLCKDHEFAEIVQGSNESYISVCDRKSPFGNRIKDALAIYEKLYGEYGERTKRAKDVSGADLKGISHSIRIGEQIKEMLTHGGVIFPLANREFIRDVKYGRIDSHVYMSYIENLFLECEELSDNSSLPEEVDSDFIEKLCIYAHEVSVGLR